MGKQLIRRILIAFPLLCFSFATARSEDLFLRHLSTYTFRETCSAWTRAGDYVYVGTSSGFEIIDVRDPAKPLFVSATDTIAYPSDIAVRGSHAYLASSTGGLVIFDISNLQEPWLAGSYFLPAGIVSFQLRENLLFATDRTFNKSGLLILDVSDPSAPRKVSLAPTLDPPSHVSVSANKACVVAGNIFTFDISDPAAPRKLGEYRDFFDSGTEAALQGNTFYVASADLGLKIFDVTADQPALIAHHPQYKASALAVHESWAILQLALGGVVVLDLTDPRAPRPIGRYPAPGAAENIVYFNGQLQIVGINDLVTIQVESASLRRLGEMKTPGEFRDIASYRTTQNFLLAANHDAGVDFINISNPALPQFAAHYPFRFAQSIAVSGTTAAFTDDSTNLHLVDITNPASPQKLGGRDFYGYWLADVALTGNHALIANRTGHQYDPPKSLRIVDVADPANPRELGGWDSTAVAVKGQYAYLVSPDDTVFWGITVIDLSDPANPRRVNHLRTVDYPSDLAIDGDTLVVANGLGGIFIADISDPANPRRVGGHDTPGNAVQVALAPPLAYVADHSAGVLVFDISNREAPRLLGGNSAISAVRVALAENCVAVSAGTDGLYLLEKFQPPIRLSWARSAAGLQLNASGAPGESFHLQAADSPSGPWRNIHQSTFTQSDLTLPLPDLGASAAYFRIIQP
jgi:hypothetical protein